MVDGALMMSASSEIASFEQKWSVAYPELALAARFFPESQRTARIAFACIGFEIAHTAFRIREAQVAVSKLQWWAEEWVHLGAGQARHPLTKALAATASENAVESSTWQALIAGALRQRDAEPCSSLDRALDLMRAFYQPLAEVESVLFGGIDVRAQATSGALSRLLHETIVLPESLEAGHLVLPLDLMAKHGLSRSALEVQSEPTRAALRDWFSMIGKEMATIDVRLVSPLAAASLSADRARAHRASKSQDPLSSAAQGLDRLPLAVVWATWRSARRMTRLPHGP